MAKSCTKYGFTSPSKEDVVIKKKPKEGSDNNGRIKEFVETQQACTAYCMKQMKQISAIV